MTREQVQSIFADATAEQITSLLNIHSADIGKAKAPSAQLQTDLDAVRSELQEAKNTISQLEKHKGDLNCLKMSCIYFLIVLILNRKKCRRFKRFQM